MRNGRFKHIRETKATAFGLAALMAATMIPAVPAMAKGDDSEGSVYYLNFKPEQADQWSDLAKKYTDETGVPVTVVTAASGTYESTLKSEMAKDEVPGKRTGWTCILEGLLL